MYQMAVNRMNQVEVTDGWAYGLCGEVVSLNSSIELVYSAM